MPRVLTTCPHCGADLNHDGRAGWWSYRVRLYDMQTAPHEPMVDSDANLPVELPGAGRIRGLNKVLSETAAAATEHHGQPLHGFSEDDQERKLRGIRPTLSRNHGRATIRVAYDTDASHAVAGPGHKSRYLARIDILKLEGDNR